MASAGALNYGITCANCLAWPIYYIPEMKVYVCEDCCTDNEERQYRHVGDLVSEGKNPGEENSRYNYDFNNGYIYKASAWDSKEFKQELIKYKEKLKEGFVGELKTEMIAAINGRQKGKYEVTFRTEKGQTTKNFLCLKRIELNDITAEPQNLLDIAGDAIVSVTVKATLLSYVRVRAEGTRLNNGAIFTRIKPIKDQEYLTIDLHPENDTNSSEFNITLATKINSIMAHPDGPLLPEAVNTMRPIKEGLLDVRFVKSDLKNALCILDMQKLCIYNTNGLKVPNGEPFCVIYFYKEVVGGDNKELIASSITLLDNTINIVTSFGKITEGSDMQLKRSDEGPLSEGPYSWRSSFKSIVPHYKSEFTNLRSFESLQRQPLMRTEIGVFSAEQYGMSSSVHYTGTNDYGMGSAVHYNNSENVDLMDVSNPANEANEILQEMWQSAMGVFVVMDTEGFVPGSSIESGGLDPDSVKHFQRCIKEINEAIFDANYSLALSHMRGTKRIFQDTKIAMIKKFLANDDIPLLKKIFFCSDHLNEQLAFFG